MYGLSVLTYRWIVTPHPRRSLTLSTLLITSRPRLSNTSTFHIGSPSALRIGVACGIRPFAAAGSWLTVDVWGDEWFKFRIFSKEAKNNKLSRISINQALSQTKAYLLADLVMIADGQSLWKILIIRYAQARPRHDAFELIMNGVFMQVTFIELQRRNTYNSFIDSFKLI